MTVDLVEPPLPNLIWLLLSCFPLCNRFATQTGKLPAAREYLNFMLSNSSKALERDRVGDNWWLQVWLSVGKMIDADEYDAWCSFLASDERTWLTPGKILGGICIQKRPLIPQLPKIHGCLLTFVATEEMLFHDRWPRSGNRHPCKGSETLRGPRCRDDQKES